jgi:DNA polymerase I-like protein with 3'-5' exonuclease and polymerase domains
MSITDPALQTLPKGEALVRDAFIPHEGNVLVSSDWSQIEMRLMAHFSQDERLARAFRDADDTGGDFFVEMGKEIYREPDFVKADKRRGLVKNTLYASAYGAGVNKMAESAGVTYDVMKSVADGVFSTYPGIKRFQGTVEDLGVRREREEGQGYVMTPFGRRLPCDEGKVYTLTNYLLQGHAAELLKNALVQLDLAGLGDYMTLPVHDEVIFSIPKEDAAEAMHLIGDVMSITEGYMVNIPADPEGPLDRWGEKYRDEPFDPTGAEMVTA